MGYYADDGQVVIKEYNETNGHYKTKGFTFTTGASGITEYIISFPYQVELLAGTCDFQYAELGDYVDFDVAPDTLIGITMTEGVSGNDVLTVNDTARDNTGNGYYLEIGNYTYQVVRTEELENPVYFHPPFKENIPAYTPIFQTIRMVESLYAVHGRTVEIGANKIGASFIPRGVPIKIKYFSVSNTPKQIFFTLDLLY
jgi:hypothetical protein